MHELRKTTKFQDRRLTSGSYQQAHPRYVMKLGISVQILIPEETFSTKSMDARVVDLSAQGMQIRFPALSEELYHRLLHRTRLARIRMVHPIRQDIIKITGRIIWIDFHKSNRDKKDASCNMGIFFMPEDGVDNKYREFIESVAPGRVRGLPKMSVSPI